MKIATLNREAIDAFKRSWPCHGLPDNLDLLVACFAPNGDLVDYEASDEDDRRLDLSEYDGGALVALIDDAKAVASDKPLFHGSI